MAGAVQEERARLCHRVVVAVWVAEAGAAVLHRSSVAGQEWGCPHRRADEASTGVHHPLEILASFPAQTIANTLLYRGSLKEELIEEVLKVFQKSFSMHFIMAIYNF